jgi:hypothetical protein
MTRYLLLLFALAGCNHSKKSTLTPPRNDREAHVYKYTDLYMNAQLAGKADSAAYYFNIAMKYDSIYKISKHQ